MGSAEAPLLTLERRLAPPVVALVAANCVPILGVLLFRWDVFSILLLFWIENLTIGAVNVLKLVSASPADPVRWIGKLFYVPFFCVHYGIFCAVHGMFVVAFFGSTALGGTPSVPGLFRFIAANGLQWAILSLVFSHLLSFWYNFIRADEYQRASLGDVMQQPYSRVIVLHLTILFGGFAVMALNSPAGALVLLVVLKTALDLRAHLKERRKFAQAGRVGLPSPAIGV